MVWTLSCCAGPLVMAMRRGFVASGPWRFRNHNGLNYVLVLPFEYSGD